MTGTSGVSRNGHITIIIGPLIWYLGQINFVMDDEIYISY